MDAKQTLHDYLRAQREALFWKVDGLSERQLRMPATPTGTNLLGLLKHVALVDAEYFGVVFGRPFQDPQYGQLPDDPTADLWARPEESVDDIRGLAQRAWAHSDATIEELDLDAVGRVEWWQRDRQEVTLHRILVHVIAETARHAGHADILRELADGRAGLLPSDSNLPDVDWDGYVAKLCGIAESFD